MATVENIREKLVLMAHRVGSQKALAESLGIPETVLSLVINGRRPPTQAMLDAVGYEAYTAYRRKLTLAPCTSPQTPASPA